MPTSPKRLRLRFDLPKKEGIGGACVLVNEVSDGFSVVVTAEHGGDVDISLTRAEFVQLQKKLAEIGT
ncbi:MAG: hypothetical protein DME26_20365 [Verrucomicrobia bacterium]|nr:MAG: hypothetical protein DME26_20365 [Verrucomicrobiota bacterium]